MGRCSPVRWLPSLRMIVIGSARMEFDGFLSRASSVVSQDGLHILDPSLIDYLDTLERSFSLEIVMLTL